MNPEAKTLITPTVAAQKLADIRKWRNQPWTPRATLTSPRLDQTVRGAGTSSLPFPLDTVTTDGAHGIDTPAGVDQLQQLWANWLSWLLNTPIKGDPGAWLYKQLEENQDLNGINQPPHDPDPTSASDTVAYTHALTNYTEWAKFERELNTCWWRVARATGNAPTNHGPCTYCGQGTMQTQPTNQGHTDNATCTHCKQTINTHNDEETKAAFRSVLRQTNREDWVTLTAAHAVWPALRKTTIIKWAQRGHIRKQDGLYHLGDINTRQHQKTVTKP